MALGDTTEIEVPLRESVDVEGQIGFERPEDASAGCIAGTEVGLVPDGFTPQMLALGSPASMDGRFRISNVFPGSYRIAVRSLKQGCFLKEVRFRDRIASEAFIRVEEGDGPRRVTLVVTRRGGTLEGTVTGPDGVPVPEAAVVVVRRGDHGPVAAVESYASVADGEGRYKLEAISPGRYRVLAFKRVVSEEFLDPLFWQEQDGGLDITIEAGGAIAADLQVVR